MKYLSFALVGGLFGVIMTKSEAISWFRILEMFRFESFHMYGIIGVAVIASAAIIWLFKQNKISTLYGEEVSYSPMELRPKRHLLAGSIFGLGWALVGACPGPMYILIGNGFGIIALVLLGAVAGTYAYGALQKHLPH